MRIGVISDIHGNSIALRQSLKALKEKFSVDDVFFLGDAVGYMPDANEVLEILRKENIKSLMGNHEAMLLGWLPNDPKSDTVYQLERTKQAMKKDHLNFIRGLLPFREVVIEGTKILMVHGSPVNPLNGYVYPDTDISSLRIQGYDFILMGHTHRPFVKQTNTTCYVNVGSCGMPRDVGDLSSLAIIDTERKHAGIYRFTMNVVAMARKYQNHLHPDVEKLWSRKVSSENIEGEIIS